ncbi:MAG TPA: hypothetical protein VK689_01230, partial [Armatimonadota bacterium]|nr:hypothetical protein [Armatimonadota bacterium]
AMVAGRHFLFCSGYFLAVTVAMARWPGGQFLLFGLAWCALLVSLGVWFRASRASVASRRL